MGSWGLETDAAEVSRDTCFFGAANGPPFAFSPNPYGRYVIRAIGDSQTVTSFTRTCSATFPASAS